jgi:hypothetical protein
MTMGWMMDAMVMADRCRRHRSDDDDDEHKTQELRYSYVPRFPYGIPTF